VRQTLREPWTTKGVNYRGRSQGYRRQGYSPEGRAQMDSCQLGQGRERRTTLQRQVKHRTRDILRGLEARYLRVQGLNAPPGHLQAPDSCDSGCGKRVTTGDHHLARDDGPLLYQDSKPPFGYLVDASPAGWSILPRRVLRVAEDFFQALVRDPVEPVRVVRVLF
jgi:hypothetical protein